MATEKPLVGFVVGSKSDLTYVEKALGLLQEFGIAYELRVISAHRTPEVAAEYAAGAEAAGLKVIIAAAGSAAHLAGAIASRTTLPVIGVPIPSSDLKGLDSLLATAQMPSGVPVATMAMGEAGAANAVILAAEILSLNDPSLSDKLRSYRQHLAEKVRRDDAAQSSRHEN